MAEMYKKQWNKNEKAHSRKIEELRSSFTNYERSQSTSLDQCSTETPRSTNFLELKLQEQRFRIEELETDVSYFRKRGCQTTREKPLENTLSFDRENDLMSLVNQINTHLNSADSVDHSLQESFKSLRTKLDSLSLT